MGTIGDGSTGDFLVVRICVWTRVVADPVPRVDEGRGDEYAGFGDSYNEGVYVTGNGGGGTDCVGVFPSIGDEVVTARPMSSGEGDDEYLRVSRCAGSRGSGGCSPSILMTIDSALDEAALSGEARMLMLCKLGFFL